MDLEIIYLAITKNGKTDVASDELLKRLRRLGACAKQRRAEGRQHGVAAHLRLAARADEDARDAGLREALCHRGVVHRHVLGGARGAQPFERATSAKHLILEVRRPAVA